MKAWHFTSGRLRNGLPIPPDGETLVHKGPLVMCQSGLHASKRLIDALNYAPGHILHRVDLSGELLHESDKSVATERTSLWRIDAEDVLRRFARRCALDVIHLWDAPDVVVKYLKTGDPLLRAAARDAARATVLAAVLAGDAARAAAWAAAGDAARAAAGDAARAAARHASLATVWAGAAARAAIWDAQNRRLTSMVMAERRKQHDTQRD